MKAMKKREAEKRLGFSIAEAMIVLLITSIALAAAAPLFTKRNQLSNNGNSKWMLTRNGSDITRARSKVGIGVPTNDNPAAMLDIRHNNNDFIIVKKNGTDVFSLNRNGTLMVNIPSATSARAISVRQNGTENAFINSNGVSQFKIASLFNNAGDVLSIGTSAADVKARINANGLITTTQGLTSAGLITANGGISTAHLTSAGQITGNGGISTTTLTASGLLTAGGGITSTGLASSGLVTINGAGRNTVFSIQQNGTQTAWIRADGSSSFGDMPAGAVVAFNLAACPATWRPLTSVVANTQGAFIRNIGENAAPRAQVQLDAAPNLKGNLAMVTGGYGIIGSNGFLSTDSSIKYDNIKSSVYRNLLPQIVFDASKASASYGRDATIEVRPKNIALLYCVKD